MNASLESPLLRYYIYRLASLIVVEQKMLPVKDSKIRYLLSSASNHDRTFLNLSLIPLMCVVLENTCLAQHLHYALRLEQRLLVPPYDQ